MGRGTLERQQNNPKFLLDWFFCRSCHSTSYTIRPQQIRQVWRRYQETGQHMRAAHKRASTKEAEHVSAPSCAEEQKHCQNPTNRPLVGHWSAYFWWSCDIHVLRWHKGLMSLSGSCNHRQCSSTGIQRIPQLAGTDDLVSPQIIVAGNNGKCQLSCMVPVSQKHARLPLIFISFEKINY